MKSWQIFPFKASNPYNHKSLKIKAHHHETNCKVKFSVKLSNFTLKIPTYKAQYRHLIEDKS